MIHAIQIPVDEQRPLYKVAINGLSSMQEAVGGYVQFIDLGPLHASMVMNEEGKLQKLPINRRATLMFWLLFPSVRHNDVIVGDAILVGLPDKDGNTTDVPQEVVDLLFGEKQLKAEFQTFDDDNKFNGNLMRFDDYFVAANYALGKAESWTAVQRCRVVLAED
ncbi:hypothetical protein QFZ70_001461 [Arthrobacter sp. V1I9]|uniref:DUF3846 domain-containing protein n=1 Tax=Arthrobacter sp. V1I9 TaxID=3042275 RepID=UPI002793AD60|nr:DUF3846 domain-containing protein [Arthrobacter sp. V1I9]MDQ0868988.1 hypothetical protein [Arthrobacter sp. V1I9]